MTDAQDSLRQMQVTLNKIEVKNSVLASDFEATKYKDDALQREQKKLTSELFTVRVKYF